MPEADQTVLILAAAPGDSAQAERFLSSVGFSAQTCADMPELTRAIQQGCGSIFIAEECIPRSGINPLADVVADQPAWSDLPIVVALTRNSRFANYHREILTALGNVLLIERPFSAETFVATIGAGLRARTRQYQVRDLIREREQILASLEVRVAERTAKLSALNEQLEAFSYTVSHDLRSPLRSLSGYAQVLLEDFSEALPEVAAMCAQKISRSAQRLDQLTTDLLTYAHIAKNQMALQPEDLEPIVQEVIEEYPSLAQWKHCIVVTSPLGRALIHRAALAQCLANLLENSIRFAKPGEPPSVRIYSENRGTTVRLCVADQGIGIEPKHHDKIFQIFETVEATKGSQTGIGLAIVRKAITHMGGSVGVESIPGKGTTFRLDLQKGSVKN